MDARPILSVPDQDGDKSADDSELYMTPSLKHRLYVPHHGHAGGHAPSAGAAGAASSSSSSSALGGGQTVLGAAGAFGDDDGSSSLASTGPPLGNLTTFSYSLGHFLNDATASCWFSYLLLYLEQARDLSGLEAGAVLFSGQLADAIATPIVGLLSDSSGGCACLGLGRRKFWNALGVLVVLVAFFFVFGFCLPCALSADGEASSTAKTVSFAVFAALFNVGWAAVQVSHMALVPELTDDEGERVLLNSARYGATVLANVFVFAAMACILHFYDGGNEDNKYDPKVYFFITLASMGAGGACSLGFLFGTPERVGARAPEAEGSAAAAAGAEGGKSLGDSSDADAGASLSAPLLPLVAKETVTLEKLPLLAAAKRRGVDADAVNTPSTAPGAANSPPLSPPSSSSTSMRESRSLGSANRPKVMGACDWFRMGDFYKVASVYMFTRLATNVSQVYLTFYVTASLQMDQTAIAVVPLLIYISSLGVTSLLKRCDRHFGRRNLMTLGALAFLAACLSMVFLPVSLSAIMYPTALLLGVGSSICMVVSVSLEADLVGRNVESAAFLYGAVSLTDKLSNGIAVLGIQYVGDTISEEEAHATFVRYVNGVIPAIAIVLATIVTWTIRFPKHLQGAAASNASSINRDEATAGSIKDKRQTGSAADAASSLKAESALSASVLIGTPEPPAQSTSEFAVGAVKRGSVSSLAAPLLTEKFSSKTSPTGIALTAFAP